jgi:hypothetical protein
MWSGLEFFISAPVPVPRSRKPELPQIRIAAAVPSLKIVFFDLTSTIKISAPALSQGGNLISAPLLPAPQNCLKVTDPDRPKTLLTFFLQSLGGVRYILRFHPCTDLANMPFHFLCLGVPHWIVEPGQS